MATPTYDGFDGTEDDSPEKQFFLLNPADMETKREKKAKRLAKQRMELDHLVMEKQNEQSLMTGLAVELSQRK